MWQVTIKRLHRKILLALIVLHFSMATPAAASYVQEYQEDDPATVRRHVEKLYDETSNAALRYEEAERRRESQAMKLSRLQDDLSAQQKRLRTAGTEIGHLARIQYQGGLLPSTLWMLTLSPDHNHLQAMSILYSAHHGLQTTFEEVRKNTKELAGRKEEAHEALSSLREEEQKTAGAKRSLRSSLSKGRQLLKYLEERQQRITSYHCHDTPYVGQTSVPDPLLLTPPVTPWSLPVQGYVLSSGFGIKGSRWAHRHTGQDFAVPIGTPVSAVGSGVVVRVGCSGAFGKNIAIQHLDGYYTHYAHLSATQVAVGERIQAGTRIGLSGNTGNSSGPHLHFEVRLTPDFGSAIDPTPWLHERGVIL